MNSRRTIVVGLVFSAGLELLAAGCKSPAKPKPNPYPEIRSENSLIENLRIAYQLRDYPKFATFFADQDSVSYLFLLSDVTPGGFGSWGAAEEKRIHRRMFQPQNQIPGESPVPPEIWLQAVEIVLTPPSTGFEERPDLYRSVNNPQGLDPTHWRATSATYEAQVFFHLAGQTDYYVVGRENFVVIEDRTKSRVNDAAKWLIYRWEDLGPGILLNTMPTKAAGPRALEVEPSSWSRVKELYD
jgi:hypothetical protein